LFFVMEQQGMFKGVSNGGIDDNTSEVVFI
jgi:hypothetical protein